MTDTIAMEALAISGVVFSRYRGEEQGFVPQLTWIAWPKRDGA